MVLDKYQTKLFSSGKIDLLTLLFIISGEITRLVVPFIHSPRQHLWSDPGRWWEYAAHMGIKTPPLALADPVFYQAWLSFITKLTLDIGGLMALYAGALSMITPWLWYRFLRELSISKRYALVGWAILAWLPSWIGIYSYYMTETLLLPLMGLGLWMSWRSMRKGDLQSFLLAALIWTLAGLTRGTAIPIAVAITPFVWWQQKNKWLSALSAALIIVIILGLTGYRSYVKSGLFAPLGHPAMNEIYVKSGSQSIETFYFSKHDEIIYSYVFQSPSMDNEIFSPFSTWKSMRKGRHSIDIDFERQAESWQSALEQVESLGVSRIWLIKENLLLLFFGPSWPDENSGYFFDKLSADTRFMWAPLFLVVIILLARRIKQGESRDSPPLLAALLLWLIVQGLMLFAVNEGRYRKPIEGLVIVALIVAGARRANTHSDRGAGSKEGKSS